MNYSHLVLKHATQYESHPTPSPSAAHPFKIRSQEGSASCSIFSQRVEQNNTQGISHAGVENVRANKRSVLF